jgi:hypothetical protein
MPPGEERNTVGVRAMQSVTEDLKRRSDEAEVFYLSLADGPTFRDYTAEEDRMIGLFEGLSGTVESIPSAILVDANKLRERLPKLFEEILEELMLRVGGKYAGGGYFEPSSAGAFVEKLNACAVGRSQSGRFRTPNTAEPHYRVVEGSREACPVAR